jgi:ABC-2 type transport system permease protein
MTARRSIWEVARRELMERSRSRVVRVTLALLLVLSVGGAIAAARIGQTSPRDDIGLVGARAATFEPIIQAQAQALGRRVRVQRLAGVADASRALRDGSLDAALVDGRQVIVKRSRSNQAARLVQSAVAAQAVIGRLRAAGLSREQAVQALAPRPLPVKALEPSTRETDRNRGLLYIGTLVLFLALISFGQAVAASVAEEKSSRVVEVLLTTLSPRRLLAGKVLGVGLVGIVLLFIPGVAALGAGALAGRSGLPSAAPEAIALVLLWFVLGYFLYSVAYAAVGALVSRHEDLDTAGMPVNALLIASWIVAMVAFDEPNGTLARICAFIPPFAPMVVPARMVLGDMSVLGLIGAVAIDLLATAALILVAARIYERAILHMGARLTFRRVLGGQAPRRHRFLPGGPVSNAR